MPVYGRRLFREIIRTFPDRTEFCISGPERLSRSPEPSSCTAGGSQVPHGQLPTAIQLTPCQHAPYWNCSRPRPVERGQGSSISAARPRRAIPTGSRSNGAPTRVQAEWQHYVRRGNATQCGPTTRVWAADPHLATAPVGLTRWIGPMILAASLMGDEGRQDDPGPKVVPLLAAPWPRSAGDISLPSGWPITRPPSPSRPPSHPIGSFSGDDAPMPGLDSTRISSNSSPERGGSSA